MAGGETTGVLASLRSLGQFTRFSAIGVTLTLPLAGAATADEPPAAGTAVRLLGAGVGYHLFAFVLNDVCDLRIDRTQPLRARSPLVQGRVPPFVGLLVAAAGAALSVALLPSEGSGWAAAMLGLSIVLGCAYNILGKRVPWPLATDLVQSLAWACLVWSAALAAGQPTAATAALMGFVVPYILMANGILGALRDLANDVCHGARTTPVVFGAVPLDHGRVRITRALKVYAALLQAAIVALSGALAWALAHDDITAVYGAVAWIAMSSLGSRLFVLALRQTDLGTMPLVTGALHLLTSLGVVVMLVILHLPWLVATSIVAAYAAPIFSYRWLIDDMRRRPADALLLP